MRVHAALLVLACMILLPDPASAIRLERLTTSPPEGQGPVWSSEPAWSPDGRHISFTRAFYAEDRQGFTAEITLLSLEDGSMQPVPVPESAPRDAMPGQSSWSPDAQRVAFSLQPGLAIYDLQQRRFDMLVGDHQGDLTPSWSPTGNRIAFQSTQRGIMDIWVVDLKKQETENLLGRNAVDGFPTWSPDGKHMAIVSNVKGSYDIWILPVGKGYPRQLTTDFRSDIQPAWSPDGEFIVFVSDREGSSDLWVKPSRGGEATRLTWDAGEEVQPDWSPDGKSIVFTSNRSGGLELWLLTDLPPSDFLQRNFSDHARRTR